MNMMNRKQERDEKRAADKLANKRTPAEKPPKLHELAPADMASAIRIGSAKEPGSTFDSGFHAVRLGGDKGSKVKAIQIGSTVWPNAISFPTAELATTGVAVVTAIAEKVGPGRKGRGYKAEQMQDLLLDQSRNFSDGEGHQLVTQAFPASLTLPVGQDMSEFVKGATAYLTELAEGIESGNEAVVGHMAKLTKLGQARKDQADEKRAEKKAAKLKAQAEAEVAAKASK